MKMSLKYFLLIFCLLIIQNFAHAQKTIVDRYGKLTVKGSHIMSEYGDTVQLRGMALFWSQWMGKYYNKSCVKWLKNDWKCTVVRPCMGVEMGGYLENPEIEIEKVDSVVQACIDLGLYVIIDYHSHEAHKNPEAAIKFFSRMAKKYHKYPNVIYELYNEPLSVSWTEVLKPYADKLISAIRAIDPDNLILMGTRSWSQMVTDPLKDKIQDPNVAYVMHYYADTHKDWLRKETEDALKGGLAIFVSEMGTCDASGNKGFNPQESKIWFDFLDKNKISWCNWSVSDKNETASIIKPGLHDTEFGNWTQDELTESGKFVRAEIIAKNTPVLNAKFKKKK